MAVSDIVDTAVNAVGTGIGLDLPRKVARQINSIAKQIFGDSVGDWVPTTNEVNAYITKLLANIKSGQDKLLTQLQNAINALPPALSQNAKNAINKRRNQLLEQQNRVIEDTHKVNATENALRDMAYEVDQGSVFKAKSRADEIKKQANDMVGQLERTISNV